MAHAGCKHSLNLTPNCCPAYIQALETRELEVQEQQAQLATTELLLSQAREDAAAALQQLEQQLAGQHEQEAAALRRELQVRLAAWQWAGMPWALRIATAVGMPTGDA